jgi:predicted O-methyltransferase YrrM
MSDDRWTEIDNYISGHLLQDSDALTSTRLHNVANKLPPIDVSATQGKMLFLMAQMAGARRILEVGTLGGYSTIWLAQALPEDGRLFTLEVDSKHARVAMENIERAGLRSKVEIVIGSASDSLAAMPVSDPFDFVFIDADKQGNVGYVAEAIRLGRPGTTIIVDNVIREGAIIDPGNDDPRVVGTRKLFDYVSNHPRLDATAVQTVGSKGWDGFLIARVC